MQMERAESPNVPSVAMWIASGAYARNSFSNPARGKTASLISE
jgi:hypothetical protein